MGEIDSERLYKIIESTTTIYRKGSIAERKTLGDVEVVELFGYEHTDAAPKDDNLQKVDMIFVDVVVNRAESEKYRSELKKILRDYPEPERLAGGPSYIELSPNCGMEQEGGLRLMALGKILGLWEVVSGKTLGMDDATSRELAGKGFLNISGYKVR